MTELKWINRTVKREIKKSIWRDAGTGKTYESLGARDHRDTLLFDLVAEWEEGEVLHTPELATDPNVTYMEVKNHQMTVCGYRRLVKESLIDRIAVETTSDTPSSRIS